MKNVSQGIAHNMFHNLCQASQVYRDHFIAYFAPIFRFSAVIIPALGILL